MAQLRNLAIVIGLSVLMTSCGSSAGDPPDPSDPVTAIGPVANVTVDGFAFGPATLTVSVGTDVVWTNAQDVLHTVTADDASWHSGNVASGETFSHTFDTAGTFPYHCEIHPTMTAEIVVEG